MSENGELYTAGKNFTLPRALTAWTNSTSGSSRREHFIFLVNVRAKVLEENFTLFVTKLSVTLTCMTSPTIC